MIRGLAFIVALAAGGCTKGGGGACDAEALRRAVETVERKRQEHPAWFGDPSGGSLSGPLVRDELVKACPKLPADLGYQLEVYASMWDSSPPLRRMSEDLAKTFRARRDKVCKDPTVFAELPSMDPTERGTALGARCGFEEEYRPGKRLGEAMSRVGLFAPVFRQYLVDGGIDPVLAKRTVELLGYPFPHEQAKAKLPRVPEGAVYAPEGGLLVRATAESLTLVEGPSVALSDGTKLEPKTLTDWINAQMPDDAPGLYVHIVLDFDASLPASTVAAVVSAADRETSTVVHVLSKAAQGWLSSEVFLDGPHNAESTHVLRVEAGTLTVHKRGDGDNPELSSPVAEGLKPLTVWAAQFRIRPSVDIDPSELDVQGLVDIMVALRGADCRLLGTMHGEEVPGECHVVQYGFVTN